jgi:hypothetical protein
MLDPLTALGLASNIVQFISFAWDLVADGRELYHSADGSSVKNKDAEILAADLERVAAPLSSSAEGLAKNGNVEDADEASLRQLCERCTRIAAELQSHLGIFKALGSRQSDNKLQRFARSGRQAIVAAWS